MYLIQHVTVFLSGRSLKINSTIIKRQRLFLICIYYPIVKRQLRLTNAYLTNCYTPHLFLYKRNCKGDFFIPYKKWFEWFKWFEWYLNHGKFHNTGSQKYPPTRTITHKQKHLQCLPLLCVYPDVIETLIIFLNTTSHILML